MIDLLCPRLTAAHRPTSQRDSTSPTGAEIVTHNPRPVTVGRLVPPPGRLCSHRWVNRLPLQVRRHRCKSLLDQTAVRAVQCAESMPRKGILSKFNSMVDPVAKLLDGDREDAPAGIKQSSAADNIKVTHR